MDDVYTNEVQEVDKSSVTVRDKSHPTPVRCGPDRPRSERKHSLAGSKLCLQIHALGKRQIAWKIDHRPSRGSGETHLAILAKGEESQPLFAR